jgi:cellulose synthase/poly-beta-1,6-N-acetylglucosamine synthase-like glycosyltransferase
LYTGFQALGFLRGHGLPSTVCLLDCPYCILPIRVYLPKWDAPDLANSWEHVSKLFERCLKSVCNQTSSNFRVMVVCNERPKINFSHSQITYIEVNFPLPCSTFEAKTLDRGHKVLIGIIWVQKIKYSHVMAVDADDCVSKHLAKFVEQNSHCNGWFINKGYIYQDGSQLIYSKPKKFHIVCGTCNIIKLDLYDTFSDLKREKKGLIQKYYGGNKYILEKLGEQGKVIETLPFKGAISIIENGENYAIALLQDRAVFPTLLTFIFILYGLQPKVKQLDSARVGLVALTSSVDDVMSLLDCSNKPYIRSGQIPFIGLQQAISFESVTFCYNPQEKPAIQDISIRIPDIFQLVAQMPDIRYVQEPRPGLSVARNTGIRQSKGDIIAFTDDDVTVHPNWIARLQQSFPDPQVMAVTGLVLPAELETEAQFIFEKNVVQPVQELMFA